MPLSVEEVRAFYGLDAAGTAMPGTEGAMREGASQQSIIDAFSAFQAGQFGPSAPETFYGDGPTPVSSSPSSRLTTGSSQTLDQRYLNTIDAQNREYIDRRIAELGEDQAARDRVTIFLPDGSPAPITESGLLSGLGRVSGGLGGVVGGGAAAGVIGIAGLTARMGAGAARSVLQRVGGLIPSGVRQSWNSLPSWVKGVALFLGIEAGSDVFLEATGLGDIPSAADIVGFPGNEGGLGLVGGVAVVGGWVAGGVQFYHLADGRKAVRKKNGVIKIWRPKRPVVMYSHGADDLRTFNKAAGIIDRQASRLAKTMSKRGFQVRRKVSPK